MTRFTIDRIIEEKEVEDLASNLIDEFIDILECEDWDVDPALIEEDLRWAFGTMHDIKVRGDGVIFSLKVEGPIVNMFVEFTKNEDAIENLLGGEFSEEDFL